LNNTKTILTAIATMLMAATLVVGGSLSAVAAQSVFPLPNTRAQDIGKGGHPGGDSSSILQACQQTFTDVLSQKQINDFEAAALSVFPSPPQKLTVVDLCKLLTTGTITEQLMNKILSGAQSIDVYTGISLKSRLVGIGIKFAPLIEG
jgi:predicted RecA/RadA family phage recombinase